MGRRKIGQYESCAYCKDRETCGTWSKEVYGDWGTGKKPYPTDVNCIRFKYDEQKDSITFRQDERKKR